MDDPPAPFSLILSHTSFDCALQTPIVVIEVNKKRVQTGICRTATAPSGVVPFVWRLIAPTPTTRQSVTAPILEVDQERGPAQHGTNHGETLNSYQNKGLATLGRCSAFASHPRATTTNPLEKYLRVSRKLLRGENLTCRTPGGISHLRTVRRSACSLERRSELPVCVRIIRRSSRTARRTYFA